MLIAITSPGDAPGATTTAFALTLAWPAEALLAECSPAGGKLLRGYFRCERPPDRGLWNLALEIVNRSPTIDQVLYDQVLPLDDRRQRLLLAGFTDPFLATQLTAGVWKALADLFATLPGTVIVDAGPIAPSLAFPLLHAADLVLIVLRPTLAQVAAARPRLTRLRQSLGADAKIGICLIGERPYTAADLQRLLGDLTAVFSFPDDIRSARLLAEGDGPERLRQAIWTGPLMRAAVNIAESVSKAGAAQQVPEHFGSGARR